MMMLESDDDVMSSTTDLDRRDTMSTVPDIGTQDTGTTPDLGIVKIEIEDIEYTDLTAEVNN